MNTDEEHMGDSQDHVTPDKEDRFTWVSQTPTGECGKAGHWREGGKANKGAGVSLHDPEGPSKGPVRPRGQEMTEGQR